MTSVVIWSVFAVVVCVSLFLDLFVFHKRAEEPTFSRSLKDCIFYVGLALLFGLFIWYERGGEAGMLYYTGFLVELSLSFDNIFVISLVFSGLMIPPKYHHRVLFWGILGAVVFRAIMIFLGAQLVSQFSWILYVFSVILILTGVKILWPAEEKERDIKESKIYLFLSRHLRIVRTLSSEHFIIKRRGLYFGTPLLLALVIIEVMDVIFAVDSIPAIFLITQDTMLIYTSNIFAILGLRAKYFLLASAATKFVYLKQAISIILIFIGIKIFMPVFGFHVAPMVSLLITASLLTGGILLSIYAKKA